MSLVLRSLALVALIASFSATLRAADWAIDTSIFDGQSHKPSATARTVFHSGRIYDFIGDQTTIFDPSAGRFTLLDATRERKTEISTEQLLELTARLQAAALRRSDELWRTAAKPDFDVSWREKESELLFRNELLTYRATTTRPEDASLVEQFRTFADWYARLNAVQPGRLPPHARLAVNEELSRRGLVPTAIELTISPQGGEKAVRRSEHRIIAKLRDEDRARIAEADAAAGKYDRESFAAFHGVGPKK